MPRNVRNFWIEADIDGRTSQFASGPVRKDGGFTLNVYQHDAGGVSHPLTIRGYALANGAVVLTVEDVRGREYGQPAQELFRHCTQRGR